MKMVECTKKQINNLLFLDECTYLLIDLKIYDKK